MKKNGVLPNERTMAAVYAASRLAPEGDGSSRRIESDMIQMGIAPSTFESKRDRIGRQSSRSRSILDRREASANEFKSQAQRLANGRNSRKMRYIENRNQLPERPRTIESSNPV